MKWSSKGVPDVAVGEAALLGHHLWIRCQTCRFLDPRRGDPASRASGAGRHGYGLCIAPLASSE